MNRKAIIKELGANLHKLGFKRGTFTPLGRGGDVVILIGESLHNFKFKSGISKRDFTFQMGRIAGLAEAYGLKARAETKLIVQANPKPKTNGHITQRDWVSEFRLPDTQAAV